MIMLGYVNDGIVYLATDTVVVENDIKRNELSPLNYKVKKLKNGLIVGITGVPKVRQRVLANEEIFALDKKGNLTKKQIVSKIMPKLHAFLKEKELYEIEDDGKHNAGILLMLAKDDKLYFVTRALGIFRITKRFAMGAFCDLCTGAMDEIDSNGDIEKQLVEIMQRATTDTKFIGAPYITINTKDQEYKVMEVK